MDSSDEDSPELETLDVSNDKHYQKIVTNKNRDYIHQDFLEVPKYGSPTIKHTLAAYDLWRQFFPTYLIIEKFRNFHRPKLRHYNTGPQAVSHRKLKAVPIRNLSRQIYRSQKDLTNRIVRAINSGKSRSEIVNSILLIRKAKDLTAKNGELFLFEYSEEHPPVLSQIGMAANIKTYVNSVPNCAKRHAMTTTDRDNVGSIAETITCNQEKTSSQTGKSTSCSNIRCAIGTREILSDQKKPEHIYFSLPKQGSETMFIENNLYRAPIYPHNVSDCDFLVIRTRNNIYIRSFHKIFTVGQTMPLEIIPPPSSKAISRFRVSLSNLYIHKLFKASDADEATLDLSVLAKLFPDYDRGSLRRRISRAGARCIGDGYFRRGTSKFGLNSLREDRSIIKPEDYCLSMSMLANRQRLRELNYSESMIMPTDTAVLETEVLAAPWNTSKAIHEAIFSSRSYLDLKEHLIDPTGPRREGFSCVNWVKSPTEDELRAKQGSHIAKASIQPSSPAQTNPAMKIKREKLERLEIYKSQARLISEVQSDVLGSHEVLSSDEGSDAEVDDVDENPMDTSLDEQLKDVERMVVDGCTAEELDYEKEEEERRGLISMLDMDVDLAIKVPVQTKVQDEVGQYRNKVLKIVRTYRNPGGIFESTELVREPQIIARYCQEKKRATDLSPQQLVDTAQNILPTPETTASPLANWDSLNGSTRRNSLGPTELSRVDGTRVIISKKVLLTNRPSRRRC